MKLAKTIIITVLATLLTLSVSLNIFVFTIFEIHDVDSFKEVLIATELIDSFKDLEQGTDEDNKDEVPDTNIEDDDNSSNVTDIPTTEIPDSEPSTEDTSTPDVEDEEDESTETIPTDTIIFSEEGVTISYVTFFEDMWGLNFKFCVENNSDKTVNVYFNDVYVDDFATSLSGGSCLDLLPGKKAFVELTIYESEYKEITDYPSYIEYTIRLRDSETYNIIVEQDSNTIELE
jgi:hypothetical protein